MSILDTYAGFNAEPPETTADLATALADTLATTKSRPQREKLTALSASLERVQAAETAYGEALAALPSIAAAEATIRAEADARIAEVQASAEARVSEARAAAGGDFAAVIERSALAERARWSAVLASPEAEGRTDLAVALLASPMSADQITAALAKAPEPASAANPFARFMAANGGPAVPSASVSGAPVDAKEARIAELRSRRYTFTS
jgi:hypothetical protein